MRDLIGRLASRMKLPRHQVERTASLFDDDNTLPFIARYRKEMTGGLDEEILANFRDQLAVLRKLDTRQKTILKTIKEQGKLTTELEREIEEAETMQIVEDLYLPYKPRRRTRAQAARERGLEPMASWILDQEYFDASLDSVAADYLSDEVPDSESAWQGARDIVAEIISDDAGVREVARRFTWDYGALKSKVADQAKDPKHTYETYYEFSGGLRRLKPHQVLALNRAESDGALRVKVGAGEDEAIIAAIGDRYLADGNSPLAGQLNLAIDEAYKRLVAPAIGRETRRDLTQWAGEHAIGVFATNLRNLLLAPPIKGATVLGIDPGYRTGCKMAVVDETGRVIEAGAIYPHSPQEHWEESLDILAEAISRYGVDLIAIGNGTASRETEELAAQLIAEGATVKYLMVSEAGASVYSASPLARAELPDLDVSLRGAVNIARRVQDPLAELVKIDPKSIGVGMYQHDIDQKSLGESLAWVTESVVNSVGVDVNTASPALLQHVSGVGARVAANIVAHRDTNGAFSSRTGLKKVKGMGAKTFEQAAGFLRIPSAKNLLDRTGVHPESYKAVKVLMGTLNLKLDDPELGAKLGRAQSAYDVKKLSEGIGIGVMTLTDIFAELQRPGRDPRDDVPPPILRDDVLKMEDLKPGMMLKGTVRNVVDFGAFVDVGVKQDGLVHISEMANHRIKSPYDVVGVGDVVDVKVLKVDLDRGRIGLSMKS